MYNRMRLDRIGTIMHGDKVVCNRMSMTPEMTFSAGEKICINTENTFTVSKMSEGTILSFYSVQGEIDGSWFAHEGKSYFLSTLTRIDGHNSFWKGNKSFGELLNKNYLMTLDTKYAWSFFLYYKTKQYVLLNLWDILDCVFITPDKWPKYVDNSKWSLKSVNISDDIFKFNNKELNFLSALTKKKIPENQKLLYPDWIKLHIGKNQPSDLDNVISRDDNGIKINLNLPILVTIYCGSEIFTVKIMTKEDVTMQLISSRSQDKYEALFIAIIRKEDTKHFENKYFTLSELYNFEEKIKNGKKKFFKQIFEKDVLKKYITFPDKIYNTVHLGSILNSNRSFQEKQYCAWEELIKCRGWRMCALSTFYEVYVK